MGLVFYGTRVGADDLDADAAEQKRTRLQCLAQLLKQRYPGMDMIVGRDKLDELQVRFMFACPSYVGSSYGVRHKIETFERFLNKNPGFQRKVMRLRVSATTFSRVYAP